MQRHTISQGKPCIASIRKEIREDAMQRYTISGKKSCVETWGRTRRRATVQRHTIFDRKTCIANMNNGRRPCTVQRHTFSGEKTCVASTGRGKNKPSPHHNALHDTTIQHITTAQNKTPIPTPDNTTNIQNLIPYLKHHTPPHIQQKPFPQKGGRALLKYIRANWASNLLDSRAYRRPKPAIAPKQLYSPGPTSSKHRPDPLTLELPSEGRGAEDGGV